MGKGSTPRPFGVKDDVFSENYCRTFGHRWRGDYCANCGAKAEASSKVETDGYGGQGKAQDGRQG